MYAASALHNSVLPTLHNPLTIPPNARIGTGTYGTRSTTGRCYFVVFCAGTQGQRARLAGRREGLRLAFDFAQPFPKLYDSCACHGKHSVIPDSCVYVQLPSRCYPAQAIILRFILRRTLPGAHHSSWAAIEFSLLTLSRFMGRTEKQKKQKHIWKLGLH